jgi:hypothetical protein
MGMMGRWMEARAQLSIMVKLTIGFFSNACWEGQDAQQCFRDRKPTRFAMPIPNLAYMV